MRALRERPTQLSLLLDDDILNPLRENIHRRCEHSRCGRQLLDLLDGVVAEGADLRATLRPLGRGVDVVPQLRQVPHDVDLGVGVPEPGLQRDAELLQLEVNEGDGPLGFLHRPVGAVVSASDGATAGLTRAVGGLGGLDQIKAVVAHDLQVLDVCGRRLEGRPRRLGNAGPCAVLCRGHGAAGLRGQARGGVGLRLRKSLQVEGL
mmetsp:Transcript_119722/g.343987  ORF Transcript_119722/g.343987 Transcript_119722/m.343987 type:complete len:206 (-) Transcript_119722:222-839(-)